jgi:hypothetical protein
MKDMTDTVVTNHGEEEMNITIKRMEDELNHNSKVFRSENKYFLISPYTQFDTFDDLCSHYNWDKRRIRTTSNIDGNTCYFNALIQILLHSTIFLKYVHSTGTDRNWLKDLLQNLFYVYFLEDSTDDDFEETHYIPIMRTIVQKWGQKHSAKDKNSYADSSELMSFLIAEIMQNDPGAKNIFGWCKSMETRTCKKCGNKKVFPNYVDGNIAVLENFTVPYEWNEANILVPVDALVDTRLLSNDDDIQSVCNNECCENVGIQSNHTKSIEIIPQGTVEMIAIAIPRCNSEQHHSTNHITTKYSLKMRPEERFEKFDGSSYSLDSFVVYKNKHFYSMIRIGDKWFEVDANSAKLIDFPDLQDLFAKSATMCFYSTFDDQIKTTKQSLHHFHTEILGLSADQSALDSKNIKIVENNDGSVDIPTTSHHPFFAVHFNKIRESSLTKSRKKMRVVHKDRMRNVWEVADAVPSKFEMNKVTTISLNEEMKNVFSVLFLVTETLQEGTCTLTRWLSVDKNRSEKKKNFNLLEGSPLLL